MGTALCSVKREVRGGGRMGSTTLPRNAVPPFATVLMPGQGANRRNWKHL